MQPLCSKSAARAPAGRITDRDLAHYNTAHVVFEPKNMTAEELYSGYLWMYREFYSLKNIIRRYPRAKAQRASYLLFNLLYRKYGCLTAAMARVVPMQSLGRLAAWLSYRIEPGEDRADKRSKAPESQGRLSESQ
jgi:hypothetical protein